MRRLALVAAGAAAVAGLTACSHTTAQSTSSGNPTATHTVAQFNCSQLYTTWEHGQGKGVATALTAVSSAASAGDTQALTVALEQAKPAFARASRHPIPDCADPKGYWTVLMMHVSAAASTHSAASMRAALKGVPKINRELTAELKRTGV